jgi:hypothetical protein
VDGTSKSASGKLLLEQRLKKGINRDGQDEQDKNRKNDVGFKSSYVLSIPV